MSQVNIVVKPNGAVSVNPPTVHIDRVDQSITWNLTGGQWEPNGIVMDENPPSPFLPWPGPQPTLVGSNYVGNAGDPLPQGATAQTYRYTINITRGSGEKVTEFVHPENDEISIDPDVENDPQP